MNLAGISAAQLQDRLAAVQARSIPELFNDKADAEGRTVAIRFKRDGVFRSFTWREYRDEVRKVAAGLRQRGLDSGEPIALMGDVCIEYLLADLAATFIGAVPCGIYPTSSPDELAYMLRLCGARVFWAEDQEHLDRLLAAEEKENAPLVDSIIVCDERALFLYDDPRDRTVQQGCRRWRRRHRRSSCD